MHFEIHQTEDYHRDYLESLLDSIKFCQQNLDHLRGTF